MDNSRQLEEAAILDGYTRIETRKTPDVYGNDSSGVFRRVPNYLNDHNAIQELIDGMDEETADTYLFKLDRVVCREKEQLLGRIIGGRLANSLLVKANCEQKLEAILFVYKVWDD